jgi:hypothetical protein
MKAAVVLASTLCLFASAHAHAQERAAAPTAPHMVGASPAEISDKRSLSDMDRGRLAGAEFARCIAKRLPKRVDAVLAMPTAEAYRGAMAKLATDDCLANGQLRFNGGVLRGALFVELVRERSAVESRGSAWTRPFAPLDVTAPVARPEIQQAFLLRFADCVVRRSPEVARNVVLLPTASAEQEAALKQLRPHLGPCFPAGMTVKISKAMLEGALAEVLYRTPAMSWTPAAEEMK